MQRFISAAVLLISFGAVVPIPGQTSPSHAHEDQHIQGDSKQDGAAAPKSPTTMNPAQPPSDQRHADGDGTNEHPWVVNVAKLPRVATEDKSMGASDWALLVFNGLLVLVGAAQAVYVALTLRAIKTQATLMGRQADSMDKAEATAKKSADAALLNAQAAVNAARAWVLVDPALIPAENPWFFKITAKNYGNAPAEILWVFWDFYVLDFGMHLRPEPEYGPENAKFTHRHWVAPSADPFTVVEIDARAAYEFHLPDDWEGMESGKKRFWILGVVRYRDSIDGKEHESRFCYFKAPNVPRVLLMGGPPKYNDCT